MAFPVDVAFPDPQVLGSFFPGDFGVVEDDCFGWLFSSLCEMDSLSFVGVDVESDTLCPFGEFLIAVGGS